jgi:hypothetical protein
MTNSPETSQRIPKGTPPLGGWRWALTVGLSIGLGMAWARSVVSTFWPGLSAPWDTLVTAAMAGVTCGIVALAVGRLFGLLPGTQASAWGIHLNTVHCPACDQPMPTFRWPTGIAQLLWGGWTCRHCGCRMDKWGKALEQHVPTNNG